METTNRGSLISIVTPAYNEEENLRHLYERVRGVMESTGLDFEFIVVENGSSDGSLQLLKRLREKDDRVHYVSLSRNFGHQGALTAGLDCSRGDAVVSMDADLQHPPELVAEMVRYWQQGYEVIFTTKRGKSQSVLRRIINRWFYSLVSRLSKMELSGGLSDFRMLDRSAVDALCSLPERNKFLRGLTKWIGFRQIGIEYEESVRAAGESKFGFSHLFLFALDGIFSFSVVPLRMFTIFGLVVSSSAFLYLIYIVMRGIHALVTGDYGRIPPGWPELAAASFFFGGVQLLGIGLLGEYLGRVYDETKQRPIYLIRESSIPPRQGPQNERVDQVVRG